MRLKVALFSPTPTSLYARLVAHLIQGEERIDLVGITVRSMWSLRRIRSELRRDGARLIQKVYVKLWLGEQEQYAGDSETLSELAAELDLPRENLRQLAAHREIPFAQVSDLNNTGSVEFLRGLSPDLVVFCGGGLIRDQILSIPALGILNCHSGVLPAYRGMDVVEWAILESDGEPEIGLTLHFMDQGVDTGPILLHHHESIRPGDTLKRVRRRMELAMVALMLDGLRGLRDAELQAKPQPEDARRQYYVMHPVLKSATTKKFRTLADRVR